MLDFDPFGYRFDDPVRVAQQVQVVLDVSRRDAFRVRPVHEGRGIGLEHPRDRALGERVPVAAVPGHDVEQNDIVAGVGDVGGDGAAHQAGADDGGLFDWHQAASRTVEIPWPPPMHWVARA